MVKYAFVSCIDNFGIFGGEQNNKIIHVTYISTRSNNNNMILSMTVYITIFKGI